MIQRMAISLKTTSKCDGACKHCVAKPWMQRVSGNETGLNHVETLIEQSIRYGYEWDGIVLTGGEPLLWSHLAEGAKMLRESGVFKRIRMFTNGLAITGGSVRKKFERALEHIDNVRISQYFGNEVAIEKMKGIPKVTVTDHRYWNIPPTRPAGTLETDCTCRAFGMFRDKMDICPTARMLAAYHGWNPEDVTSVLLGVGNFMARFEGIDPYAQKACLYCLGNRYVAEAAEETANIVRKPQYEMIDRSNGKGKLLIGDGASISRRVSIDTSADVTIGERVVISEDALIITHDHDMEAPFDKDRITRSSLIIGDDAFIGARAIITGNVRFIGARAVVGAGSVVTKDVPQAVTVAGNPAKPI